MDKYVYFLRYIVLKLVVVLILIFCIVFLSLSFKETPFWKRGEKWIFRFPSKYANVLSENIRSILADIFYIQGIMSVTDKYIFDDIQKWREYVHNNFGLSILFDHKFLDAYFFAGVVVATDRRGLEEGISFLKKYLKFNPHNWRILYWIGFNYYQLGDYLKAVSYYKQASLLPGAPNFLKSNQPMLYYKAGRPDLGIAYLEGLLKSVKNEKQLHWIKKKLEWLKNIIFLEEKVNDFKNRFGRNPTNLEELVKYGLISSIPSDPFGRGYYLDKNTGRVKSRFFLSSPSTHSFCPHCKN